MGLDLDSFTDRWLLEDIHRRLYRLERHLTNQLRREIMNAFDDLTAAVTAQTTEVASVVTLLQGVAALQRTVADDSNRAQALAAAITANTTTLANAVVANTPSAPAAPPAPATPPAAAPPAAPTTPTGTAPAAPPAPPPAPEPPPAPPPPPTTPAAPGT